MNKTPIEWTDFSSNPIYAVDTNGRRGWQCTKVSLGCNECYSERNNKFRGTGLAFTQENTNKVQFVLSRKEFDAWFRLKKPSKIFIEDMSDLFLREIPDDYICECYQAMQKAKQHIFQTLSKRPLRMLNFQTKYFPDGFPPNIWAGTSVENYECTPRIDILRKVDASIRFISFEPLLGSILPVNLAGISWAISGGESDFRKPRPANPDWFREIKDECKKQGVAYFHKQNGGMTKCSCHKSWGCRLLDGRTYDEMPK